MSIPETHKVILFNETSESLDVLKYVDHPTPQVEGPHDIIIKNKYSGINFIEAYFRKGYYPATLPYILGREASGVVVATGDQVAGFKVGDKVAYLGGSSFAQYTKVLDTVSTILKLDDSTSDKQLKDYAAGLLQGLTALTFATEAHEIKKGEYILIWAAAGGVGRILTQIAAKKGAHVIAVVSTEEKAKLVHDLGAEYVINSSKEDVLARVKEISSIGVHATFDSVGKDSFQTSFDALARKGSFVSYGNSSGLVPPLSINTLSPKNIKLCRPQLFAYVTEKAEWEKYTQELFRLIDEGEILLDIFAVYELKDYAKAAAELEGRRTTGKLVLEIPQ